LFLLATVPLGEIGDRRAIVPLLRALKGSEDNDILYALRRIDPDWTNSKEAKEAAEILINVVNGTVQGSPKDAAKGLSYLKDPRSVEPLIKLLKNSEYWTKVTVVNTLGAIGDPRAIEPLQKCINNESSSSEIRKAVEAALKSIEQKNKK